MRNDSTTDPIKLWHPYPNIKKGIIAGLKYGTIFGLLCGLWTIFTPGFVDPMPSSWFEYIHIMRILWKEPGHWYSALFTFLALLGFVFPVVALLTAFKKE